VLATELHSQLQDLSGSLTQMIDSVNALSATDEATTEDPMNQIVGILSSHLESLQWIDGSVRDIETKVGDVEKRVREAGGVNGHGPPSRSGFGLR
jgi:nuclear pore complex protein Nup62